MFPNGQTLPNGKTNEFGLYLHLPTESTAGASEPTVFPIDFFFKLESPNENFKMISLWEAEFFNIFGANIGSEPYEERYGAGFSADEVAAFFEKCTGEVTLHIWLRLYEDGPDVAKWGTEAFEKEMMKWEDCQYECGDDEEYWENWKSRLVRGRQLCG
jgi:hypothetical protein